MILLMAHKDHWKKTRTVLLGKSYYDAQILEDNVGKRCARITIRLLEVNHPPLRMMQMLQFPCNGGVRIAILIMVNLVIYNDKRYMYVIHKYIHVNKYAPINASINCIYTNYINIYISYHYTSRISNIQ